MSCFDGLLPRVRFFKHILNTFASWVKCVEGGNEDNKMTDFEKCRIQSKIRSLKKRYEIALEKMGKVDSNGRSFTWEDTTTEATTTVS